MPGISRDQAAPAEEADRRHPSPDGASRDQPPGSGGFGGRALLVVLLAHCASVLWLFGAAFSSGQLLYFRDLLTTYAPWYVFTANSLSQGVWPLWNPTANAGVPFLIAYPVDLALLAIGGWKAPLGVGPALHLLLALVGGSWLARRLGMGPWGAWLVGSVYGLGGTLLSLVNLVQLFEAAAWAPWVIAAFLSLTSRPSARRIACLAVLLALQASTLGAEVLLETALFAITLIWRREWPRSGRLGAWLAAALLAGVLALPALLGVRALIAGSGRAEGFALSDALAFSLHPATLPELVLPFWLGDPHAFSDADYWGRAFFPDGYPYLLSLYLGLSVLLLAIQARGQRRLWGLAIVGLVLAVGAYGPLGLLPAHATFPLRGPQKLVFLSHLALALLAGHGLERRLARWSPGRLRRWLPVLPGAVFVTLALAVSIAPELLRVAATHLLPALHDARAAVAARSTWPAVWLPASFLALGTGLALARGGRYARLAAVAALLDLLVVNSGVNPLAPPSFYDLRPDVAGLLAQACDDGRLFSYGAGRTPGLRFERIMTRAPSDVWLYYLDRQSLMPLTHVLDGLEGALDEDRTGWSPRGSTLTPAEAVPTRFRDYHRRLQQAGVRWVLSFDELPDDLVAERGRVKLPEIVSPLVLYELRDALPRAFFVAQRRIEADPSRVQRILADPSFDAARTVLLESEPVVPGVSIGDLAPDVHSGQAVVRYEPVDAHTVRLVARTPPGLIVVLDGYHPEWMADDGAGPVPLLRANGRYRAVPTPGGARVFTLRYAPRWRRPALLASALAVVACLLLAARRERAGVQPGPRPTTC